LAANLYNLLLSSAGAVLIVKRRFEEARPHFFRREVVNLAIFNSNIFGKKVEEITERIAKDGALRDVAKLFICKAGDAEKGWPERLGALSNSKVISRPFHPDEFKDVITKMMEGNA